VQPTRRAILSGPAIAGLFSAALIGGCGFIKINGKTLGSSAAASSGSGGGGGEGGGAGAPDAEPGRTSARPGNQPGPTGFPPAEICRWEGGDSRGTLEELERALATKEPEYAASSLMTAYCTTEGEYARERDEVQRIARAWMQPRHMDTRDLITLYQIGRGKADSLQDPADLPGLVGDYGKARTRRTPSDAFYTSALWTVARLYACFDLKSGPFRGEQHSLASLIVCSRYRLDVAKIDAEIDATEGMSESTRYRLRAEVGRAIDAARSSFRTLTERAAKEPRVKELVALAEKEYAQWRKPSPERAEIVALYQKLMDARLAKQPAAFAGCAEATAALWSKTVRGLALPELSEHPSAYEYARVMLRSTETSLAFGALRLCSEHSETEETAPRGLHFSARDTSQSAVWELIEDAEEGEDREDSGFGFSGDLHKGEIARIRELAGGLEVTFKKVMEKQEQCQQRRRTNRVSRIDGQGNLTYEEVCVSSRMVNVDVSDRPVRFGKVMAQGLRPGMYLYALDGLPIVATSSPRSKKPVFVLGATLR
jgi:hypothetical protein